MRTIIKGGLISEGGFSSSLSATIYDHDINKFYKKSGRISHEEAMRLTNDLTSVSSVLESIEGEEIPDEEIIEMYKFYLNSPFDYRQQEEFLIIERYVKSLYRNEKLEDLGI